MPSMTALATQAYLECLPCQALAQGCHLSSITLHAHIQAGEVNLKD
jgi:hypothetical protein